MCVVYNIDYLFVVIFNYNTAGGVSVTKRSISKL